MVKKLMLSMYTRELMNQVRFLCQMIANFEFCYKVKQEA